MATNQIRGNTQIIAATITNAEISASAAIATSKLADGADFIKRTGTVAFTADQSHGGFKITSLADPTADQDGATKAYVDSVASGLDVKKSVRVATTANGALATAYENGDTVDGVVLATGDRILIKDQTTGSENGIYTVNAVGSPTRATDADSSSEVTAGMFTFVAEGTTNADTGWVLTTNDASTLGTTALVFTQFTGTGSITAGAGLTKTGSTLDVGAGDGITVNADDVAVNTTAIAGTGLENDGSNNLRIAASAAGAGLTGGAGSALAVGAGTGITVNADDVAVNSTTVQFKADEIYNETPSGSINSSNVTFTLANTPVTGSVQLYLNGLRQRLTTDFTMSGGTITMTTAPTTGDNLIADYDK